MQKKNPIKELAKRQGIEMPEQNAFVKRAIDLLVYQRNLTRDDISQQFDTLIVELLNKIYDLYLESEREYVQRALQTYFRYRANSGGFDVEGLIQDIGQSHTELDTFYLSLSQSRGSRSGKTFQDIHRILFRRLNVPFDEQPKIDGRPDFVMPSTAHYHLNALDCLIFTAKRTLRERWRQIVTEGVKGYGFFLATIDIQVSKEQIKEMHKNRIYIVCPSELKTTQYSEHLNVLSYRQFFQDYVELAQIRWRRNGIIP